MLSTSAVRSARARIGSLQGGFATIVVPNPYGLRHVVNEYLTVANLASTRRRGQSLEQLLATRIADDDFDFKLGQKIYHVFAAPINLLMALLPAMPPHFGDSHAIHADSHQRFFDFIQLKRLNDRLNFFHPIVLS